MKRFIFGLGAAALLLPSVATAATISGSVTYPSGTGEPAMEVRLWQETPKGYGIIATVRPDAAGAYIFINVAAGDYRMDTRMRDGIDSTQARASDTWYDVAPPTSGGIFFDDADVLTVADTDVLAGIDIEIQLTGGVWGTAYIGGARALQKVVRAESTTDFRYYHQDISDYTSPAVHNGEFWFRGLLPTHAFRVVAYDPVGNAGLLVVPGPFAVTQGADNAIGNVTLPAMAADANEPNNDIGAAVAIGALPFASSGSIVAPRGDVDWFCMTAADGDRIIAKVDTSVDIDGQTRAHPWFDPILGFFSGSGTLLLSNDDETPRATFMPVVDTGVLTAGQYCFAVSAFGDTDWTGAGQQTAGPFELSVVMGNREPSMSVTSGGFPIVSPATLTQDEGDPLSFEFTFSDPDGDMLMTNVVVIDANGNADPSGVLTLNASDGTFIWTPSQTAASEGPWEVVITTTDGEFVEEVRVTVTVNPVNVMPTIPILDSPIARARVTMGGGLVPLVLQNSTDPDLDSLDYDYQLEIGTPDDAPEMQSSVAEDVSGLTTWTTMMIPENSVVWWRARADDGNGPGGISMWSAYESFVVDAMNEPPSVPDIVKPTPNEILTVTIPTISSLAPIDPEGDAVVVRFEIATDVNFENVASSSADIPVTDISMNVEWMSDALPDGQRFFVRAQAEDELGAMSAWSQPVEFRIPSGDFPDVPGWTGDLAGCVDGPVILSMAPDSITVSNVDSSGATVEFDFQILEPGNDQPIYEITVPQADGPTTDIPVDSSVLRDNGQYVFQIRTVRGDMMRDWVGCDVGVSAEDEPAIRLEVLRPNDGDTFGKASEVRVVVRNPYDPDPVEQFEMRYCVSTDLDFASCPANVSEYTQQNWAGEGESEIDIDGLKSGDTRWFKVCAVEVGGNTCVMEDTVWFKVGDGTSSSAEEGCGCASTSGKDAGSVLLFLFGLFVIRRRRKR